MAESTFDVVVIGGGPGGYVCAIRAAQLGFKVACVEKRGTLGGTCLNVGCIPSKALLAASEKFEEAAHGLAKFGIKVGGVELDLPGMQAHKDKVVKDNVTGIEFLFKKNKIAWLKGAGKITAANTVEVEGVGTITASKAIVIATGSDVTPLPGIAIDEKRVVSSTGALSLPEVPKHLVVIGGGVIGLELGSVWGRLGAKVTVVEYLDRVLPTMDGELSKQAQRIFAKQGMDFKLSTKVTGASVTETGVTLTVEPAAGGAAQTIDADAVLVAIGRRPYTEGLGLEAVGVELERGRVKIDGHFQTNVPGIYAIGDVVEGPMLAHKAEEEGVALAEQLAGQKSHVNHDLVPGVVYTWPEVAAVGKTEEQLKAAGVAYKAGKFPFTANGRARAGGNTDGFVKILSDAATDQVLGVHMIGPNVSEMIGELVLAMEFSASAEDVARTCHAHPTLSEAVKEAALAVDGRPLHI
ncbi:dihydrolipoamide dehydrogenase [Azospirillum lipoferum]|uniref:Dihydrolipoyl dehydrogenase n=1 Tax=Azospirillum lipoferum TaxID=193 RepID=A0A5A9GWK8_AZOLI|nr:MULTISPECIES: dihydrolipoyl dehydrogenase [Azospirillum]KAA0597954.1 dihydrolipoyl dehydrogenase [Azospirillum lipoferum]MCP1609900.1 dihydrolipoamide dehydrogenase [Azospirillum lipoferum]MDW5534607.1 dihydrolipoyl dehydrogenase [Azospirillum sp. NL1]